MTSTEGSILVLVFGCRRPKAEAVKGNPVRRTHQGATPGLYPHLCAVGVLKNGHWGCILWQPWEGEHIQPDHREPEYLPGVLKL